MNPQERYYARKEGLFYLKSGIGIIIACLAACSVLGGCCIMLYLSVYLRHY